MLDFRLLTYEIGNPREIISMRSLRTIDSLLDVNRLVLLRQIITFNFLFRFILSIVN